MNHGFHDHLGITTNEVTITCCFDTDTTRIQIILHVILDNTGEKHFTRTFHSSLSSTSHKFLQHSDSAIPTHFVSTYHFSHMLCFLLSVVENSPNWSSSASNVCPRRICASMPIKHMIMLAATDVEQSDTFNNGEDTTLSGTQSNLGSAKDLPSFPPTTSRYDLAQRGQSLLASSDKYIKI
jgi:hypothetical protein